MWSDERRRLPGGFRGDEREPERERVRLAAGPSGRRRRQRATAQGHDLDSAGHLRQWLVNELPLLDADGEIENIVTVALDIGERKRSEQEMRKARDSAETALRNLRETQASLIEAEKLAALGRLVAGVAHEVNNPVGISLTVASALERKTANFTDEVARGDLRRSSLNEFLATSRDASSQLVANLNRAADLIQSFKQVAVDRSHAERRPFDLREATEQILVIVRPALKRSPLTLSVDIPPGIQIDSYPGPYGQVLTNLVLNAIAHGFPNRDSGSIRVDASRRGNDQVEVIFADDGAGMTEEIQRRAFEPFFTTRRSRGGTGLGLHIVYNLITRRLGGRVRLESVPDRGTTFRITLPLIAPKDEFTDASQMSLTAEST